MKKLIILILFAGVLAGCTESGTLQRLNTHPNGIEVYRYYYEDGAYVYISKFKDSNVHTVTWEEKHGKTTTIKGNIIYENDSIIITRKF